MAAARSEESSAQCAAGSPTIALHPLQEGSTQTPKRAAADPMDPKSTAKRKRFETGWRERAAEYAAGRSISRGRDTLVVEPIGEGWWLCGGPDKFKLDGVKYEVRQI